MDKEKQYPRLVVRRRTLDDFPVVQPWVVVYHKSPTFKGPVIVTASSHREVMLAADLLTREVNLVADLVMNSLKARERWLRTGEL